MKIPGGDDNKRAVIELDSVVARSAAACDGHGSGGSVMRHVESNVAPVVDADALADVGDGDHRC